MQSSPSVEPRRDPPNQFNGLPTPGMSTPFLHPNLIKLQQGRRLKSRPRTRRWNTCPLWSSTTATWTHQSPTDTTTICHLCTIRPCIRTTLLHEGQRRHPSTLLSAVVFPRLRISTSIFHRSQAHGSVPTSTNMPWVIFHRRTNVTHHRVVTRRSGANNPHVKGSHPRSAQ